MQTVVMRPAPRRIRVVFGDETIADDVAFYWDRVGAWFDGEKQLLQQPTS